MGLLERLRTGELGVKCRLPAARVLENAERYVTVVDETDLRVVFQARHLRWRLELGAGTRAERRRDIEQAARIAFERDFEATVHPVSGQPVQPRTADPRWSPVVELEEGTLSGDMVWVLRRLSYVPTNELVEGAWLLPVQDGLISLTASAHDDMTGFRESALWLKHDELGEGGPSEHPGQAFFDDPEHDSAFPNHCLSRVRAARRWLEDPEHGALRFMVSAAPELSADAEQELAEADCAVRVPPRYVRLSPGVLNMAPGLVTFTRVSLGGSEAPVMLNVWKTATRLGWGSAGRALRGVAVAHVEAWENEGAKDIAIEARLVEDEAGPEVHLHVKFQVNEPVQEVQIWFADRDGCVFRIGCSASKAWSTADLWDTVTATRRSFRRLSPIARPWWRFGR